MNYILQLNGFFDKIASEPNVNPTHISLYLALFQMWNYQHFKNPMSISRSQVLYLSKIGSKTTYHKCLKDLDALGFLNYYPSKHPLKGSQIYMLSLVGDNKSKHTRKTTPQATEKTAKTFAGTCLESQVETHSQTGSVSDLASGTTAVALAVSKPENERATQPNSEPVLVPSNKEIKTEIQTEEGINRKEVELYFESKGASKDKGSAFYLYYSKRNWQTLNNEPIRSWQLLADTWIHNALKGEAENVKKTQDNDLTSNTFYDEPL